MSTLPALLRLALTGGRGDTLRIALTAAITALTSVALLSAGAVLAISDGNCAQTSYGGSECGPGGYSSPLLDQSGLRPGTAATLVLLCIPILFLAGQCSRVGSPARDRRLAAVRMAGATPRQATGVVALEVALASLTGAVLGTVVFLLGRLSLDSPDSSGQRPLPTDVLPSALVFVLVLVAVPLLATLLSVLALRRVRLTPFGVVRRGHSHPPRVTPLVLLGVGLVMVLFAVSVTRYLYRAEVYTVTLWGLGLVLAGLGLSLGAAALAANLGALVARRLPGPAWLIAGRQLVADPWQASRSLSALLLAVLVGGAVVGVRQSVLGVLKADDVIQRDSYGNVPPIDPFYGHAFDLAELALIVAIVIAGLALLVAAAEQVVQRRRVLASLTAAGTSQGVLRRALLLQSAIPVVPGVLVAAIVGWVGAHGLYGWSITESGGGPTCVPPSSITGAAAQQAYCNVPAHQAAIPQTTVHISLGVPWAQLGLLIGIGIVGTLLITALSLTLLRRSTDIAELRAAA